MWFGLAVDFGSGKQSDEVGTDAVRQKKAKMEERKKEQDATFDWWEMGCWWKKEIKSILKEEAKVMMVKKAKH
ncbi:uncharacterized protein MONOS_12959 [Monocercomonoides exilis]|uniref:uncharacterized protein n=1 Tax=Monocercomonoides exilis TaxID=2049356 RepID=UPI00355A1BC1|nr:hypothetical protein MONOS_12959 [Monocercomonoides exilis]|eukprot:MONOS_12959.1-p1 / transcript=MONOS_12959.1 / gene=MONOS_12959 / organism=Monocercomonoides_exilis_PA203 / gene_product=unspecified product / transcript_product=unspecified product / location=Mono_scaffold00759:29787-30005(+) / protein_length=73 / sequence_SO=supercontig / SO=protein_coding / is_pseudo=false